MATRSQDKQPLGFTPRDHARIGKVIREVERGDKGRRFHRRRYPVGTGATTGKTVVLTDKTTVEGIGYYHWVQVDKTGPNFPETAGGLMGSYCDGTAAIELNGSNANIHLESMRVIIYPLSGQDVQSCSSIESCDSSSNSCGASWWFDVAVPQGPLNPTQI